MKGYVYVAVDETGNLGKPLKGDTKYTLVACVVSDRKKFEDATRKLGFEEEVKYNTHRMCRKKVLTAASPAISDVFYVCYSKVGGLNRFQQSDIHLDMVRSLADSVVLRYGMTNDLVVEIDHKDGISDIIVSDLFSMNGYKVKRIYAEVMDSATSYGLQTNDFIAGAVGAMANKADYQYVRLLKKEPYRTYIKSHNTKPGKNTQGEHASVPRTTCHTDSFRRNSPPGIATRLMGYLRPGARSGTPVVRLGVRSLAEYKNSSENERDFQ